MTTVWDEITIGRLALRNRFMRSATAEYLADAVSGAPDPRLGDMYRELAEGEVALIVTGHVCVNASGRTNRWMASMADDALISPWREVIQPAQARGSRVMLQINHGASNIMGDVVDDPISPSGVQTREGLTPRAMSEQELLGLVSDYGQAARRAREAGFDGVQIHAAHGYLITQFLSPWTNQREDAWGGDADGREAFLREVIRSVRGQVGDDYPVWTKLGFAGREISGLTFELGARAAALCTREGLECIELSHGLGIPESIDLSQDVAYRPIGEAARKAVGPEQPLALVSGMRRMEAMNEVIDSGLAQMVSLCRPFIAQPHLVRDLRTGACTEVACVRCDRCVRDTKEGGLGCANKVVARRVAEMSE